MTSGTSSLTQSNNIAYSPSKFVTVVDVYDLAESINRDFESIAEKFGKDCIESIVKKVICALETLEAFAKNNDTNNFEVLDMQKTIEHLQHERLLRIQDKENLEKDVVDLEENYKKEIDELCHMVKNLQAENKNIKRQISLAESINENNLRSTLPEQGVVTVCEKKFQMMVDLRSMSFKQKDQIKDLQKDVESYCCEVENLQNNIERLIRQNKELLRKNSSMQNQGRLLVQERANLMRRLQSTEENNFQLKLMLSETSRACKDMEAEREFERETERSPRFTLKELREVLQEKTSLKARVMELEEQLDFFKGSSSNTSEVPQNLEQELENLNVCLGSVNNCKKKQICFSGPSNSTISNTNILIESMPCKNKPIADSSRECLVYGPIDREPEEKLNPLKYERKHSGVRKLFQFFKEFNSSGSKSPHRIPANIQTSSSELSNSLSTLTILSEPTQMTNEGL